MPQLQQIMEALNQFAPWNLAESWDNVGLQVGHDDQPATKVMVALDMNEQVIREGLKLQVNGFVVHHPLIFKPLTEVNLDTPVGRCLEELIKHRLFLIAVHTNADKAADGLNQSLANQFGLTDIELLEPCTDPSLPKFYKVVVFAPEKSVAAIRNAMVQAGAGVIGHYTDCSFEIAGNGTFRPDNQAVPFIGKPSEFTRVSEIRLEMLVPGNKLAKVSEAVRANHPYQEPAIDIYPVFVRVKQGMGRVGKLKEPLKLKDFALWVKQKLFANDIRVSGELDKLLYTVAICSGSGGSLLKRVLKSRADVFLTGELNYHDFLLARENGLAVLAAGHWATEYGFVDLIVRYFNEYFKTVADCKFIPSKVLQAEPYITL